MQNFITFMDALKLKLRAKDQLHPLLTELMQSYARFSRSNEWSGRPKILHWLIELNQLKGASDEISDEQARQVRVVPCVRFFVFLSRRGRGCGEEY